MAHRSLLEFRCDTCGSAVQVDVTEGGDVDDDWPLGWILVKASVIGVDEEDEKVFCPKHSQPLVRALGFSSLAVMRAALEAVEDARASAEERRQVRELRAAHGDIIETEDGSILLINDEEDD